MVKILDALPSCQTHRFFADVSHGHGFSTDLYRFADCHTILFFQTSSPIFTGFFTDSHVLPDFSQADSQIFALTCFSKTSHRFTDFYPIVHRFTNFHRFFTHDEVWKSRSRRFFTGWNQRLLAYFFVQYLFFGFQRL